jgi:hypothetical protein
MTLIPQVPDSQSGELNARWNGSAVGTGDGGQAFVNHGVEIGFPVMTSFHQFSAFAASRGEGLHPRLQALHERAASPPFAEVSIRGDGMIQAGPSPDSEITLSRVNVTPFARKPAGPATATAAQPEMQKLSTEHPKRGRFV